MKALSAVFLGVGLAATMIGCAGGGPVEPPGEPGSGPWLYVVKACGNCHGQEGQGSKTGPALKELGAHWDEEQLVAYLGDPKSVQAESPRLQVLSGAYPLNMPPAPDADERQLRTLAQHLLGMEGGVSPPAVRRW